MSEPEQKCSFCHRGKEVEDVCGDLFSSPSCSAHRKCMQYSAGLSQYKFDSFGGFEIGEVEREIKRGKKLRCSICYSKKLRKEIDHPMWMIYGATAGCAISTCKKTFHYYCAKISKTHLVERLTCQRGETEYVKYRTFCSMEHYNTYMTSSDSQQDAGNLEEYAGEPLADYLSEDEEDATSLGNRSRIPSGDSDGSDHLRDSIDGRSVSPMLTQTPKDQKRANPDDPDDTPRKRKKQDIKENEVPTMTVLFFDGDDKVVDMSSVTVKQEPVEDEVSSTSQRSARLSTEARRSSLMSDTLEDVEDGDEASVKRACVICFADTKNLNSESVLAIKNQVNKTMKVEHDEIFFWAEIANQRMYWCEDKYMKYFMLDIIKAIRDKRYMYLRDLLQQPDEKLEQYKGQHSFNLQFEGDIHTCLQRILTTQVDHYAEQVNRGTEITAQTLALNQMNSGETYVMFVKLNETTDPGCTLRNNFSKQYVLHLLNKTCEFKHHEMPLVQRETLRERELATLRLWLRARTERTYEVHTYPTEDMLLNVDDSVAYKLSQEFILGSTAHADCDVVFFRAINTDIINHKAYCHQVIRSHTEQLIAPKRVFYVFDVSQVNGYEQWKDLFPDDLNKDVLVWSSFDPARFPVTCVIVHIVKEDNKGTDDRIQACLTKIRRYARKSLRVTT